MSSYFSDLIPDEEKEPVEGGKSYFSDVEEFPSGWKSQFRPTPKEVIKSKLSAPVRGAIKAGGEVPTIKNFIPKGGLSNIFTHGGPISPELGKRITEQVLPIRPEDEYLERAGKIGAYAATGPESIPMKLLQLVGGTVGGELAAAGGLGETGQSIAEAVSMGVPGIVKGLAGLGKGVAKTTTETLPSGLPKIKAIEAKRPGLGTLSSERQVHVVKNLNKEASKLTKSSVHKNLPMAKAVEAGVDFEKNFQTGFSNLRTAAKKANPEIDITPISKLLRETAGKYRGIPSPNPEAVKVLKEVRALANNPQTSLNRLLNIYRDNNKKVSSIYETSRITGRQKEYVDFLMDMNRAIAKSFETTLPEDSQWLTQFKDLNRDYKAVLDAKEVMGKLKGLLSGKPKAAEIERLATDQRTQEKLAVRMGRQGAQEVTQIAKDLKASREALKSIPKSRLTKYDAAFPLYFLIPFIGKILGIKKAVDIGRYMYGWLLSTQSRRTAYREALKAFLNNDLEGYKKATLLLRKEMEKED